jgi:TRAP-type mannitol/chloroaromatic compound transport system substrate-binding protein
MTLSRSGFVAVLFGSTLLALPASAQNFDLQSVYGLQFPASGQAPVQWAERVTRSTNGALTFTVHGAGDIVPPFEVFGAVASGAIPFGYDWTSYWANSVPVAGLLGGMPFGPDPDLHLAWLYNGGGLELIQRTFDAYNVRVIPCQMLVPEAGGWFNREINSVADLQGLNMRFAGLGAAIIARLGVNTMLIPGGEIYVSLERGRIDATEFSAPTLDVGFGFQNIAKYYYFPGWHQPSSNLDVWNGLTADQQASIEDACYANITQILAQQVHAQIDALETIEAAGVEVRRFPDDVLAALREATAAEMEALSAADPLFKEAYDSLTAYIQRTRRWSELQALPRD